MSIKIFVNMMTNYINIQIKLIPTDNLIITTSNINDKYKEANDKTGVFEFGNDNGDNDKLKENLKIQII